MSTGTGRFKHVSVRGRTDTELREMTIEECRERDARNLQAARDDMARAEKTIADLGKESARLDALEAKRTVPVVGR